MALIPLPSAERTEIARLRRLVELAMAGGPAHTVSGLVHRINPGFITVSGLSKFVRIGETVSISSVHEDILGEVTLIDAQVIHVTPLQTGAQIELGGQVRALNGQLALHPDPSWRGRVINPLGEPLDRFGLLRSGTMRYPLHGSAPAAMTRARLGAAMTTGIKAIDLFTPICCGQRMGIFAGSGVGKSSLLAMLSRTGAFDTIVLGLIGERGREVREFLDDVLSESRMRALAVVATSDESPMMRRLAPSAAMAAAEYFRDRGENVLLILDSITRYAHAIRELSGAFEELPVARGYPPSAFSALPRLLERAGPGASGSGTITAFVSVLVDGDDHNEPISDSVRGILDGHIVLSRNIAAQGRFPAVDPLRSISRLSSKLRSGEQARFCGQILELIARFEDTKDLRTIGGYQAGADQTLDRAVELIPRLYEALKQDVNAPPVDDVYAYLGDTLVSNRRV